MKRTRKRMIFCIVLTAAVLAFIWGNSMTTGEESGAMSGRIMAWINTFMHFENAETLHLVIRKMAHFTEFACLGALLYWVFSMAGKKEGRLLVMSLLCGMAVACVDETIQLFTPDRGPSLIDVGIDTAGVAAGMMLLLIGHNHIRNKQNTE